MSKKSKVETTIINGKVDAVQYVATNGFPTTGTFSEEKWLQKFYKQLDMATLLDWVAKEGLEVKTCDSEPIYRMRVCMAILYKHFPKQASTSTKKKAKYADYTTEQLVEMAVQHDVAVEICEDTRILRMRLIMNLRASKVIE